MMECEMISDGTEIKLKKFYCVLRCIINALNVISWILLKTVLK